MANKRPVVLLVDGHLCHMDVEISNFVSKMKPTFTLQHPRLPNVLMWIFTWMKACD